VAGAPLILHLAVAALLTTDNVDRGLGAGGGDGGGGENLSFFGEFPQPRMSVTAAPWSPVDDIRWWIVSVLVPRPDGADSPTRPASLG
jgi:hypothetical protein